MDRPNWVSALVLAVPSLKTASGVLETSSFPPAKLPPQMKG